MVRAEPVGARDVGGNHNDIGTVEDRSAETRGAGRRYIDSMLEMSVSGYSADDLTEAGVRTALFGVRHPLPSISISSFCQIRSGRWRRSWMM